MLANHRRKRLSEILEVVDTTAVYRGSDFSWYESQNINSKI